jgi:hypothetical protein
MKTIFDKATREELIQRISSVNESNKNEWGKMNVSQMIAHCIKWEEMALSKKVYKQTLLGKLFGKMALKDFLKDEPFRRNVPTVPDFKIKEQNGNIVQLKGEWINLIKEYDHFDNNSNFVHPFFGRMTKEQLGILAYKHIDHHLRQFGA